MCQKCLLTPSIMQVIALLALPLQKTNRHLINYPLRALRVYNECSGQFRQSEQLFVSIGGRTKGLLVSKQRLNRWIVDAISLTYKSVDLFCPLGVRPNSTRSMVSSWVWSSRVYIADICAAAGWSSLSTFITFYNLNNLQT